MRLAGPWLAVNRVGVASSLEEVTEEEGSTYLLLCDKAQSSFTMVKVALAR